MNVRRRANPRTMVGCAYTNYCQNNRADKNTAAQVVDMIARETKTMMNDPNTAPLAIPNPRNMTFPNNFVRPKNELPKTHGQTSKNTKFQIQRTPILISANVPPKKSKYTGCPPYAKSFLPTLFARFFTAFF